MGVEKSKSLQLAAIAVALFMAWQMSSRPVGTVSLPEETSLASTAAAPTPTVAGPAVPGGSLQKKTDDKEALLQVLQQLKACYASEQCPFPHSDPKSYDLAVGQELKSLLAEYREQYGKDPQNFAEMKALAHEFILSSDEFVQEQALEMFSALPPSQENLVALTQALKDSTDPLLVEQAMQEMRRYLGGSDEALVHDYLRELLGQGGVFASEAAAKKILSFINSRSYSAYEGMSRRLPPGSAAGQNLRMALEEYRRLQSGG